MIKTPRGRSKANQQAEGKRRAEEEKDAKTLAWLTAWLDAELIGPALAWALCEPWEDFDLFTQQFYTDCLTDILEAFGNGEGTD